MYLVRTPVWLRPFFPGRTWNLPANERVLYLTFDDGPVPEVTPWVLDQLAAYRARATFFVVGANVQRHPELLARVRSEGHAVGNHTWQHLNGAHTDLRSYLEDVERTQRLTGTGLFRPPYGRMTNEQAAALRDRFDLVMWDVLSADFDPRANEKTCARNVIRHARPGSIVVFHDSIKAQERLRGSLPRVLEHFAARGYTFNALPEDGIKVPRR
jgi:peptidoglycan/xylan/chitin deacetylase (PgdA/CDA1 family)